MAAEASEIVAGLDDERPKLKQLLVDVRVGVLVVEHTARLTRIGRGYIATLLEHQGRRVEAIVPTDINVDLEEDFTAVITSMAVRL